MMHLTRLDRTTAKAHDSANSIRISNEVLKLWKTLKNFVKSHSSINKNRFTTNLMSRRVECPTFIADACLPKMKLVPISRLNKILSLDYNIAKNKEKKPPQRCKCSRNHLKTTKSFRNGHLPLLCRPSVFNWITWLKKRRYKRVNRAHCLVFDFWKNSN